MIRTLQVLDWGLLPSQPFALHQRVSVLCGQNGSGKSSAMDALKAILGVNRFGQGRSASSYIHSGRELGPPAPEAWVFACCSLPQDKPAFSDSYGDFTLLLKVTRSRRSFLVVPGHLVLGVNCPIADDLEGVKDQYPSRLWMTPEDYSRRVLSAIGVSRATQRILEIPQGEAQKLLDAKPDRLLRDLLGLMGAMEPLDALEDRRLEYAEALQERDRAKRSLLEEELASVRAEKELGDGGKLIDAEADYQSAQARCRGALQAALTEQEAERSGTLSDLKEAKERLSHLHAQPQTISDTESALHAVAEKTFTGLSEQGLSVSRLECQGVSQQLLAEAGALRYAILVKPEQWQQALTLAAEHPEAVLIKSDNEQHWWEGRSNAEARLLESHLLLEDSMLLPLVSTPVSGSDQSLSQQIWRAEREVEDLESAASRQGFRQSELERTQQDIGEGDLLPADADQLAGLIAESGRQLQRIQDLRRAESTRSDRLQALEAQRERLQEARMYLEGQEGALETGREALSEARAIYQARVVHLVEELGRNFSSLCHDADMRGEMHLTADPLAEAGGRLQVMVAETTDGPLRAYAEADLSGGWRAKTALLVLLAALAASAGTSTLKLVLSDEPFAALDEDRISEVGWTFQRLARHSGLQFVLTLPTRRASEAVEWADLSVAFLKAGPHDMYAPLPHLIEASEQATLPPA